MLILDGDQVVHHSYNSNIVPIAGDMITIGDTAVFSIKTRLLGGVDNSNKVICFGTLTQK